MTVQELQEILLEQRKNDNMGKIPLEGRTYKVTEELYNAVIKQYGVSRLIGYRLIIK